MKQRCYYDVLGVGKDSDDVCIKRAYKRMALKLHPDKNIGDESEMNDRFQELLHAYNTLIDPHERAWYDSHREAILRGIDADRVDEMNEYEMELRSLPNLRPKFSSYHQDDVNGFYNVYCRLFDEIDEIDGNVGKSPPFGSSDSDHDDVRMFYLHWGNYLTPLKFEWCDQYKLSEAPNRKTRRVMAQENKKLREKARKKRNEEVRSAVRHAKSLDKRFAEILIAEERSKSNGINKSPETEKVVDPERELLKEECWERLKSMDFTDFVDLDGKKIIVDGDCFESDEDSSLDFVDDDIIQCLVCNKTFKSDNQLNNHVRSKQHKAKLKKLQEEVTLSDDDFPTPKEVQDDFQPDQHGTSKRSKKMRKRKEKEEAKLQNCINVDEDNPPTVPPKKGKKKAPRKSQAPNNNNTQNIQSTTWLCKQCGEKFGSRNKLFQHIKSSGHALPT